MRKQEFRFQTNLPSPARRGSRSRTASPPASLAIRKAPSASVESIQPRPPRPCEDTGRRKVSGKGGEICSEILEIFYALTHRGNPTRPPRPLCRKICRPDCTESCPPASPASTQEVSESRKSA